MPSFDIVVSVDKQEVDNAINQAQKEIGQRYDFRGSKSKIDWDKKDTISLIADDDYKLKAVVDIMQSKFVKRGLSIRNFDYQKAEPASEGTLKQAVKIQEGIPTEKAKSLVKQIKDTKLKVQSSIQDDQVRVSGKKRDDLQDVIAAVRKMDLGLDFQFINMRD